MADEASRRYLFVAIDRATRWVFIRIFKAKTAANARPFLRDLERACPIRIRTILTDNDKEFTDRLFGLCRRAATGNHDFDRLCADLAMEHRLAPPMRPQTNGMVERFNGRIEPVLQTHHFHSGEGLEQTILRYVRLYNGQIPQSVLKGRTPIDALKDWHRQKPELFRQRGYNPRDVTSTGGSLRLRPAISGGRASVPAIQTAPMATRSRTGHTLLPKAAAAPEAQGFKGTRPGFVGKQLPIMIGAPVPRPETARRRPRPEQHPRPDGGTLEGRPEPVHHAGLSAGAAGQPLRFPGRDSRDAGDINHSSFRG